MKAEELNALSKEIIGASIEVHRYFGPGLLENTYRDALVREFDKRLGLLINFNKIRLIDGVTSVVNGI